MELRQRALALLRETEPTVKAQAVREWAQGVHAGSAVDTDAMLDEPPGLPGWPARPRRVPPVRLPRRNAFDAAGRAALLHAVAHIEYNAIALALDAVWRFDELPRDYYLDWARVAGEEALHFSLVAAYLATLGHAYGDFDAHDGLWQMAERTRGDALARMALVPRTLEARGLDVTPAMRAKFVSAGDTRAAEILDVILRDEIGHVAIGNRWYRWLCARDGLDPLQAYDTLARRHHAPRPKPPFNLEARRAAGFDAAELAALVDTAAQAPEAD
ncbi:MAG: ferritin-like domain-containing protein [Ideonella sp.]|nr:ferritin-like domain-containing protein [Ideonella sp.]MCC7457448.1 ferritin-like domain-containing protein [Nitrospira sp.]